MSISNIFQQIIFYAFALTLLFSAVMVIAARNPVRSALFLVLAFFASAGLWILLQVEFLGLILILVYVGAVMTLFLFVVMTLNIDRETQRDSFVRYLPYGMVVIGLLVLLMVYVIGPQHFGLTQLPPPPPLSANYSNVKALGYILYTDYAYPFEIAGILLLTAIIAAITLTFRGRQGESKASAPEQQIKVKRSERVRLINIPPERKK